MRSLVLCEPAQGLQSTTHALASDLLGNVESPGKLGVAEIFKHPAPDCVALFGGQRVYKREEFEAIDPLDRSECVVVDLKWPNR